MNTSEQCTPVRPYAVSRRNQTGLGWLPHTALLTLAILWPATATATPTVNGQFYGDMDHLEYVAFATSYYGSKMYVFYDAPTTTLYVALVVDPKVNENVFGRPPSGASTDYMSSTGWGSGGGQQRSAAVLFDSEFAGFHFACALGGAKDWTWEQGYACDSGDGVFVSDTSCGTSSGTPPPSYTSASSFAWNINTYEAAAMPKPWDRDLVGPTDADWVAPFDLGITAGLYTPVGLDGYTSVVATTAPDCLTSATADLSTVRFNSVDDWEWRMVYEWSVDLGVGGADCGSEGLFLVTGLSHHSPGKELGADEILQICETECGEENDCFPPDPGGPTEDPFSDFGDLPDSYATLGTSGGAQHHIKVVSPFLGTIAPDFELTGDPTIDATGDDDSNGDEDGVVPVDIMGMPWIPGSTQSVSITVAGTTGVDDVVGAWFDWNNNGVFDCGVGAGEFLTLTATSGDMTYLVPVPIPIGTGDDFDPVSDDLHTRFRVFSDASVAPGGSLDCPDFAGVATDGEVEDYVFPAGALPVTLLSFELE